MERWQFISTWNSVGRRSETGKVDPQKVATELGDHISAGMCYTLYLRYRKRYNLYPAKSPKRGTGTTQKRVGVSELIKMVQKTMLEIERGN